MIRKPTWRQAVAQWARRSRRWLAALICPELAEAERMLDTVYGIATTAVDHRMLGSLDAKYLIKILDVHYSRGPVQSKGGEE